MEGVVRTAETAASRGREGFTGRRNVQEILRTPQLTKKNIKMQQELGAAFKTRGNTENNYKVAPGTENHGSQNENLQKICKMERDTRRGTLCLTWPRAPSPSQNSGPAEGLRPPPRCVCFDLTLGPGQGRGQPEPSWPRSPWSVLRPLLEAQPR